MTLEHIVVCIEAGLFEIGHRIPNSDYLVPTHAIRHTADGWQLWDMVSGELLSVFRYVTDAIESVCLGEWALHAAATRH